MFSKIPFLQNHKWNYAMFQPNSLTCQWERIAKTIVTVQIHYFIIKLQEFAHRQVIFISSFICHKMYLLLS